eukprot:scaffold23484_cov66-Skeletonema_marinoi.AAC.1
MMRSPGSKGPMAWAMSVFLVVASRFWVSLSKNVNMVDDDDDDFEEVDVACGGEVDDDDVVVVLLVVV